MKDKILELRQSGKSYKQIALDLKCSKSLVAYYCKDQREACRVRQQKRRKDNVLIRKTENWISKELLRVKSRNFQTALSGGKYCKRKNVFNWKDVLDKFGEHTVCYLTGRSISIMEPRTYTFDHIVPVSKGGGYSLDNLGIACRQANLAKSDSTLQEFLDLCKEVLIHNGYKVSI
jgi:5-methylcytosine-specific restriction endonuclease McrA